MNFEMLRVIKNFLFIKNGMVYASKEHYFALTLTKLKLY